MEQNPMILAHDVLSLPFGCGKTLTKESREVRKCRNKEKQSNKTK